MVLQGQDSRTPSYLAARSVPFSRRQMRRQLIQSKTPYGSTIWHLPDFPQQQSEPAARATRQIPDNDLWVFGSLI
jgi:hypothetical protein